MANSEYSDDFVAWVTGLDMSKRARTALDILLQRGSVTTKELQELGYDHPPRAMADLKDAGVPFISTMVNVDGVRMSRYTLLNEIRDSVAVRKPIPKAFRESLFAEYHKRCEVCGGQYENRYLQADHRVPFRIGGDPARFDQAALRLFMPLCSADNRGKSWSCEHCPNWDAKDVGVCQSCFWAYPTSYTHVATVEERRLSLIFRGQQVDQYEDVAEAAAQQGLSIAEYVLARFLDLAD